MPSGVELRRGFECGHEGFEFLVLGLEATGHGGEKLPGDDQEMLFVLQILVKHMERARTLPCLADLSLSGLEFFQQVQLLGKDLNGRDLVFRQIEQKVGEDSASRAWLRPRQGPVLRPMDGSGVPFTHKLRAGAFVQALNQGSAAVRKSHSKGKTKNWLWAQMR